ncbi:MAG TPA: hypothetical protein VMG99_07140 [Thermoplasmata archaeon]|jgi:hypothetical protein|nr:hypothetical protein [Thermoplasmata archaeon]
MRHRAERGKRLLLCPRCGSPEIALVGGMIIGQVYHCPKCDYLGSLVFEAEVGPDGTPLPAPDESD